MKPDWIITEARCSHGWLFVAGHNHCYDPPAPIAWHIDHYSFRDDVLRRYDFSGAVMDDEARALFDRFVAKAASCAAPRWIAHLP